MKNFSLPLAALLIAFASGNVMAASIGTTTDATGSVSATTNAASGAVSASGGFNSSLSDKSNFADVMGSLSTSDAATLDLSNVHIKRIKFVHVSKLNGYTAAGLKADTSNVQKMAALDAKVASNAKLTAALKKSGYRPSDVVAISSDAQGSVVAFIAK